MSEHEIYTIAFSYCLGIGPMRFQALVAHFGNTTKAYEASQKELLEVLPTKTVEEFVAWRHTFKLEFIEKELKSEGITALVKENTQYPSQIAVLSDAPICLYVKGDLKSVDYENKLCIGIVGTRKPTSYGAQVTRQFAASIAQAGCIVVSGMAYGVDAIAHEAAMGEGGKTIAFLGCGVDIIYPPGNKALYNRIIAGGGVVMSEFPPGHTVLPGLFVARNRLISGISRGVVVVEGAENSGSLITARYAAEQGKDVFAPPAPITSALSHAPNMLLKNGAILATSADDILSTYQMSVSKKVSQANFDGLAEIEIAIVKLLAREELKADDLTTKLQISASDLMQKLSLLEIQGYIRKNPDGSFMIAV